MLGVLSEENVGLGSSCQSAGQVGGIIFANSGFMLLNKLIDLPLATYLQLTGVFIFFVTFLLLFFQEKSPENEEEEPSINQITQGFISIWKNSNLRLWLKNQLLWRVGYTYDLDLAS